MQTTKDYISDNDFALLCDIMDVLNEMKLYPNSCLEMVRAIDEHTGVFTDADFPFGSYQQFRQCVLDGWFSDNVVEETQRRIDEKWEEAYIEAHKDRLKQLPDLPPWNDGMCSTLSPSGFKTIEELREAERFGYERLRNRIKKAKSL